MKTQIFLTFQEPYWVVINTDFATLQHLKSFIGCKWFANEKQWKFKIDFLESFNEYSKNFNIICSEILEKKYIDFLDNKNFLEQIKNHKITEEDKKNTCCCIDLKDEQIQGAFWLLGVKKGILAFGTGVGKTFTSLEACYQLHKQFQNQKFLIITLSSLTGQWTSEIKNNFPKSIILNANKNINKRNETYLEFQELQKQNNKEPIFLITNIEKIRLDLETYKNFNFRTIIIDEASKVKAVNNKTNKKTAGKDNLNTRASVRELCKQAEYVFGLTATPVETSYENLYGIFNTINEDLFAGGLRKFQERYFFKDFFGIYSIINKENIPELKKIVSPYIFSRKIKLEVNTKVEIQRLKFNKKEQEFYTKIRQLYLENYIKKHPNADLEKAIRETALDIFGKRMQFVDFPNICFAEEFEYTESPKAKWLIENLPKMAGKTIIFDSRTMSTERIMEVLKKANIAYYFVDGSLSTKLKQKTIKNFKEDIKTNVLVCTDSLAYGQNLQFAQNMIFFNLAFNPGTLNQRSGRIIRRGQKNDVKVYVLLIEDTIEDKIFEKISQRINEAEDILNLKERLSKLDLAKMIEEK